MSIIAGDVLQTVFGACSIWKTDYKGGKCIPEHT